MRVFRIGDPRGRFPILSGDGAALIEGRWNKRGQNVIYTSEHYSTAMLETLAYRNGVLPPNQHFIAVTIPHGTSYETVTKDRLPGWIDDLVARRFGATWFAERRTAILVVPSFVAREEHNILIHPHHAGFKGIAADLERPVWWDKRLFAGR